MSIQIIYKDDNYKVNDPLIIKENTENIINIIESNIKNINNEYKECLRKIRNKINRFNNKETSLLFLEYEIIDDDNIVYFIEDLAKILLEFALKDIKEDKDFICPKNLKHLLNFQHESGKNFKYIFEQINILIDNYNYINDIKFNKEKFYKTLNKIIKLNYEEKTIKIISEEEILNHIYNNIDDFVTSNDLNKIRNNIKSYIINEISGGLIGIGGVILGIAALIFNPLFAGVYLGHDIISTGIQDMKDSQLAEYAYRLEEMNLKHQHKLEIMRTELTNNGYSLNSVLFWAIPCLLMLFGLVYWILNDWIPGKDFIKRFNALRDISNKINSIKSDLPKKLGEVNVKYFLDLIESRFKKCIRFTNNRSEVSIHILCFENYLMSVIAMLMFLSLVSLKSDGVSLSEFVKFQDLHNYSGFSSHLTRLYLDELRSLVKYNYEYMNNFNEFNIVDNTVLVFNIIKNEVNSGNKNFVNILEKLPRARE